MRRLLAICVYANTAVAAGLSFYLFVLPVAMVFRSLDDPALRGAGIPRSVFHWHQALSPKYERWARSRVLSGSASQLSTRDISGTEWPLFGSVFYLWATESPPVRSASAPRG